MKVDLAELERELRQCEGARFETEDIDELLALIRVARAAKAYMTKPYLTQHEFLDARLSLVAALSDIEDSAHG